MNLNIVILSTTFNFKLKKTQHITYIILLYNFQKNYLLNKKENWHTTLILSRTKKPKTTSIFKKYLASYAKNAAPINLSFSLLISSICQIAFPPYNTSIQQIFTKLISQRNTQLQTKNGRKEVIA